MISTIYKDGLFDGKIALITGGGTGIGLRTAKELAQLGATVVLASRKEDIVKDSAKDIQATGGKAIGLSCNIREPESIKNCIDQVLSQFGQIDFLVNNGGGQFPSPAEMIQPKGWHAVIETNLTGTFFMSQEVFTRYMQSNGGSIVNVVADMRNGFPMMAHTGAARAGVENLTKTLANEWGRYGLRINSVMPGTINSSGLNRYDPSFKEYIFGYGKFNQTFRLGTEGEVAAAIIFLLSPAASFITGVNLSVDGGQSIYHPLYPPEENTKNAFWD
jgi:NAD(P)-dependent dehydrogenase (short-subunit alcohol dehydrogenase family)